MPFKKGVAMEPLVVPFYWRLGAPATESRDWQDRGCVVMCDSRAGVEYGYVFNGMRKTTWEVSGNDEDVEEGDEAPEDAVTT